jgi:hypothetical protein
MTQPRQSHCTYKFHAAPGQGGLVAIAVSMVVALVLAATTLSGLTYLNANRTVATKLNLQTYYAAQAGIQEALATRMLPRSNYMSLTSSSNAYYTSSGKVYQNPAELNKPESTRTGLVAAYRYIVLGGDAAKDSSNNWYASGSTNTFTDIPWLLETDTIPTSSPFIIISHGITCKPLDKRAEVSADALILGSNPSCKSNFEKDEIVVVARVAMNQPGADNARPADKVDRLKIYKPRKVGAVTQPIFKLPSNAFVPGQGWTTTAPELNFHDIWTYTASNTATNPVRLSKVVFYNFTDNTIIRNVDITGSATTIAGTIPSNAAIRLYFNGPIDYRSIDPTNDRSLAGCKADADTCRIRVVSNPPMSPTNHAYSGNTMIPLLPGSSQVILLPPLTNTLPGGTPHQIQVDASGIRGPINNATGSTDYTIDFTTQ